MSNYDYPQQELVKNQAVKIYEIDQAPAQAQYYQQNNHQQQQVQFGQQQQYVPQSPQQQPKMQAFDYENQKQLLGGSDQKRGLFGSSRIGFIRKVYLILTAQLLLTVMLCGIAMSSKSLRMFQRQNLWLYITSLVLALACEIVIFCYPKVAAKVPTNYILCAVFTICFSWMISMICGFYAEEPSGYQTVFIAAGITAGIVIGLTIYALTTKTDFTTMGGALFVLLFAFMFFGIFLWIFNAREVGWVNILYCTLGVILFGFYLIYDTQIIAGGEHKRFQLDYDQYIIGAMILYIDIIQIFLYILQILGKSK